MEDSYLSFQFGKVRRFVIPFGDSVKAILHLPCQTSHENDIGFLFLIPGELDDLICRGCKPYTCLVDASCHPVEDVSLAYAAVKVLDGKYIANDSSKDSMPITLWSAPDDGIKPVKEHDGASGEVTVLHVPDVDVLALGSKCGATFGTVCPVRFGIDF